MNKPTTIKELQERSADYLAVRDVINVRVYPREWGSNRFYLETGKRSPLIDALVFDLPDVVVTVPAHLRAVWRVPIHEVFEDAVRRSYSEARVTRARVEVLPSIFVEGCVGETVYTSALLMRPELAVSDLGHGFLVAVPSAHQVLIHPISATASYRVLHPFMRMAEGLFRDNEERGLSPNVWWVRGNAAEYIGTFRLREEALPGPIMSIDLQRRIGAALGLPAVFP